MGLNGLTHTHGRVLLWLHYVTSSSLPANHYCKAISHQGISVAMKWIVLIFVVPGSEKYQIVWQLWYFGHRWPIMQERVITMYFFFYFSLLLITVKGAVVWKYWGLRNSNLINRYAFMSVFMISVCNSWKKFTFNSKVQSTMMYFPLKVYLWGPPFSAQKNPQ